MTNLLEACAISPAWLIRRPNSAELRRPSSQNTQRLVPIINELLTSPQSPIQTFQPLSSQHFSSILKSCQPNPNLTRSSNNNDCIDNGNSSRMYKTEYMKFLT